MHVVRWIVGLLLFVLFLLHWGFFRHTLYYYYEDLSEVVSTYINFHKIKNVKFRIPEDPMPLPADANTSIMVPKIIHRIWLQEDKDIDRHDAAHKTCTDLHTSEGGWQHWLWTDEIATEWVATQYPHLKDNYTSYGQTIQRSNILRYLVLHHYGGIYLDLDISCLVPLDNLLYAPFLTSSTSKLAVGVNNAFILARPQHPFLEGLVHDRISSKYRVWPSEWFETMVTTGYLFLSNAWMDYWRFHKNLKYRDSVLLLANHDWKYSEHALGGKVTTPLFKHGSAKHWHKFDAKIFLFAEKHAALVCVTLVLLTIAWLVSMFYAICGFPTRKRRLARHAKRASTIADRENRAQAMRQVNEQESNPSTAPTPAQDPYRAALISPFLEDMAPAPTQGPRPTRAGSTHGSDDGISTIVMPVRTASYAMSYPPGHARTSSLMPRSHDPYNGRPPSIYAFAYH